MDFLEKLGDVQKHLKNQKIDGWLLYDFKGQNDLACHFLQIPKLTHLTRRFFYWIPAQGMPVKIVHQIEPHVLNHLPGECRLYFQWQSLEAHLKEILRGSHRIAMEFSPRNALPYISKVDGGTIDLIREFGMQIVSSATFFQYYNCVWDEKQLKSHLEAAEFLDQTVSEAWKRIAFHLKNNRKITEYDVSQWIFEEIERHGYVTDGFPNCSVNENTANPHYCPSKEVALQIEKGDFILLDLWCKKNHENAVYADITRVGVAASSPTGKQQEIFAIVKEARDAATNWIRMCLKKKQDVKGFEVDQIARGVITKAGYGNYFIHRTGHNIHTEVHGPGAHLDSLETLDDRPLIPKTCFSIEPGVYLPGAFGVRLEYDVYITERLEILVTGGIQEEITPIVS